MKGLKLFLLLTILAVLSGCGTIRIQSLTTATPTATDTPVPPTRTPVPTETIVWFPPTSTPRPLNTPTAFPTVNALPKLGKVLIKESFTDDSSWQTFRSSSGNAVISDGFLTLAIPDSASEIISFSSLPQYGDYFLSLDVDLSICGYYKDTYSLYFRVMDSNNYYRWVFNCQGETRVERVLRGKTYILKDWTVNGVLRLSAPQKFRIGVEANGDKLSFFANDTLLYELSDGYITAGGYGLGASSEGYTALSVTFSDFRLSALQE